MMTKLSQWGIYIASYLIDYILIMMVLIMKNVFGEGTDSWNRSDLLTLGVLIILIIFSVVIANCIRKTKPNTRIDDVPEKNITNKMLGYVLAYVLSVATMIFVDWWIPINLGLFIIVGLVFVNSNRVYISPVFVFPLGYKIFQSGEDIIITDYTFQEMRMAQEDNPDGLEARELAERVFYVRKQRNK